MANRLIDWTVTVGVGKARETVQIIDFTGGQNGLAMIAGGHAV